MEAVVYQAPEQDLGALSLKEMLEKFPKNLDKLKIFIDQYSITINEKIKNFDDIITCANKISAPQFE